MGHANALTTDAAGNVHAAGYISDGVIFNQNYDHLVVKFGLDGAQRWAQRYDGPGRHTGFATQVVVDSAGNVFATGFSYGTACGHDWATLKFAADGSLRWERRLSGGPASDHRVSDMALLADGNVAVAGVTQNTGDAQTADVETVAYDPQGSIVWRARWTDTAVSHESVSDLDVDGSGRIAITGTTAENASPDVAPFPLTLRYHIRRSGALLGREVRRGGRTRLEDAAHDYLRGCDRASVRRRRRDRCGDRGRHRARHEHDGRELWRHRFGGIADPGQQDSVAALVVDAAGAALVTGTSWNGYLSNRGTADDIVTLKFAPGARARARGAEPALRPRDLAQPDPAAVAKTTRARRTASGSSAAQGPGARRSARSLSWATTRRATSTAASRATRRYSYRVRAFDGAASSPYSNSASAKTRQR